MGPFAREARAVVDLEEAGEIEQLVDRVECTRKDEVLMQDQERRRLLVGEAVEASERRGRVGEVVEVQPRLARVGGLPDSSLACRDSSRVYPARSSKPAGRGSPQNETISRAFYG